MAEPDIINFTGTYTDHEGNEHEAKDMPLEFLEYEGPDYSAGITGEALFVCAPDAKGPLEDHEVFSVDPYEWQRQCCEQTGGHNYVYHQWSEEPESACRICTRCGNEIDPA